MIPPITDPMGKNWVQPDPSSIILTKLHALMTERCFKDLAEYSATKPTGVYEGKMWKRHDGSFDFEFLARGGKPIWLLCWFGYCEESERGQQQSSPHSDSRIPLGIRGDVVMAYIDPPPSMYPRAPKPSEKMDVMDTIFDYATKFVRHRLATPFFAFCTTILAQEWHRNWTNDYGAACFAAMILTGSLVLFSSTQRRVYLKELAEQKRAESERLALEKIREEAENRARLTRFHDWLESKAAHDRYMALQKKNEEQMIRRFGPRKISVDKP